MSVRAKLPLHEGRVKGAGQFGTRPPGFPNRKSSQKQGLLLIIRFCFWWRSGRRPSFSERRGPATARSHSSTIDGRSLPLTKSPGGSNCCPLAQLINARCARSRWRWLHRHRCRARRHRASDHALRGRAARSRSGARRSRQWDGRAHRRRH
jgi:hypothetical protein